MLSLVKHEGRWIVFLSSWYCPTQETKNCNNAMQSVVVCNSFLVPLFLCPTSITPSCIKGGTIQDIGTVISINGKHLNKIHSGLYFLLWFSTLMKGARSFHVYLILISCWWNVYYSDRGYICDQLLESTILQQTIQVKMSHFSCWLHLSFAGILWTCFGIFFSV